VADPISWLFIGGAVDAVGNHIQGNVDASAARSAAQEQIAATGQAEDLLKEFTAQQEAALGTGFGEAGAAISEAVRQARLDISGASKEAEEPLAGFADLGQKAAQEQFNLATGASPLNVDPMFLREQQIGLQQAGARGTSTSPSFQAELQGALIPGLSQRRAALLSPLLSGGLQAAGGISSLRQQRGAGLANVSLQRGQGLADLSRQHGILKSGLRGELGGALSSLALRRGDILAEREISSAPQFGNFMSGVGRSLSQLGGSPFGVQQPLN